MGIRRTNTITLKTLDGKEHEYPCEVDMDSDIFIDTSIISPKTKEELGQEIKHEGAFSNLFYVYDLFTLLKHFVEVRIF